MEGKERIFSSNTIKENILSSNISGLWAATAVNDLSVSILSMWKDIIKLFMIIRENTCVLICVCHKPGKSKQFIFAIDILWRGKRTICTHLVRDPISCLTNYGVNYCACHIRRKAKPFIVAVYILWRGRRTICTRLKRDPIYCHANYDIKQTNFQIKG